MLFNYFQKGCALGYYSFGHELGHNFGAGHNKEQGFNNDYYYGHGHLIQPRKQGGAGKNHSNALLGYINEAGDCSIHAIAIASCSIGRNQNS